MTVEEKITHIQEAVMTEARAEGNQLLTEHRQALESLYDKHVAEALRQSQTHIKGEEVRARQQRNQAAAKAQVDLKRALGKRQLGLKDQLFTEVRQLLLDFMNTTDYLDLLQHYILDAAAFAGHDSLTIYLNASDADKKADLEQRSGLTLTLSSDDFCGGIRAAIPGRNILIDHSFKSKLEAEYEQFQFLGGEQIG